MRFVDDYVRLGLVPIRVWGVDKGACRCRKGNACGPSAGKHPVRVGWTDGTADDLRSYDGNVGLAIGAGYVVVDIDGERGEVSIGKYTLPSTWESASGSDRGGRHLWFRLGPHHVGLNNAVGSLNGIDLRVTGGHVVAPPSVHASGREYAWRHAPWDGPCATLPDDLYADLIARKRSPKYVAAVPMHSDLSPSQRAQSCRNYVQRMAPAISGSGGHHATFSAARVICKDFELSESDAWSVLCDFNERCQPPWSEGELRHKLNSAMQARVAVAKGLSRYARRPESTEVVPSDVVRVTGAEGAVLQVTYRNWQSDLRVKTNKQGVLLNEPIECNAVLILKHAERFAGRIRYNEFTGEIELDGVDFGPTYGGVRTGILEDDDAGRFMAFLQTAEKPEAFGGMFPADVIGRAIRIVAKYNNYHPVRDMLLSLRWDGTRRIDTWLSDFAGVEDIPYVRLVGRKTLLASVRRILDPGCQVDTTLILEGGQGAGKTSLITAMFGAEYVHASRIDIGSKDGAIVLRGKWAVEFAELEAFRGRDASTLKAFLTVRSDSYRPPYGRATVTVPRSCVFIGTTNDEEYLEDPTGGRRFWPVKVTGAIDLGGIMANREQLWAEAVEMALMGEPHWLTADEEADHAVVQQSARAVDDAWRPLIEKHLMQSGNTTTERVLTFVLQIEPGMQTKASQMRVGAILRQLGCERRKVMANGVNSWVYFSNLGTLN